ncbi:MAG: T9SS type A sorting domain-containing protein [Fibrobacteria bacterium]|nr:T9SS type A sorting domain-containing protein [Fibrobacteria bacterium]
MEGKRRIIAKKTLIIVLALSGLLIHAFVTVIAHRGASLALPENSMAAFRRAIEIGADYFELDIRTTADDSLIVMHDATVDRTTNGTGEVNQLSYNYIRSLQLTNGEKVPSLSEAMLLAKGKIKIALENKGADPQTVIDKVTALEMRDEVVFFDFSYPRLSGAKAKDPAQDAVFLVLEATTGAVDSAKSLNAEVLAVNTGENASLVSYAHQQNMKLWRYTVNDKNTMISLIKMGVDGLITDDPSTLITYLNTLDATSPSKVVLHPPLVTGVTVTLSWSAASDAESGIWGYAIYVGDSEEPTQLVKRTGNVLSANLTMVDENKTYYTRIKAINRARLYSNAYSNTVAVNSNSDTTPPEIVNVTSAGSPNTVLVRFSEVISLASAENINNYTIDRYIAASAKVSGNTAEDTVSIINATLGGDQKMVILTTATLPEAVSYRLRVKNIQDRAPVPNTIEEGTEWMFEYTGYMDGLVAYWNFNEGKGNTTVDQTVNMNNLQFTDLGWATGMEGSALVFNGTSGYVDVPASPSLDIQTTALSLSVWLNLDVLPSEMEGEYGPIYDSEKDSYVLYADKVNDELRFKVRTNKGATRPGISSADLITGEWIHVACVYNGREAGIYLNGELMDLHDSISGNIIGGQTARLGEQAGSFYAGSIDELKIFNRALTVDEIKELGTMPVTEPVTKTFALPTSLSIAPNPVRDMAQIRVAGHYNKGLPSLVTIHDIRGRLLKHWRLQTNKEQRIVSWDRTDNRGNRLRPGVYFVTLRQGEKTLTERVVVE